MIEVLVKMIICGIIECMIVNAIKPVKLKNIWALKIVPVKNVLLVNYEDVTLNVKMKY